MRNCPSKKASFEASKVYTAPLRLVVDETRSEVSDLANVLDEYGRCSEEYMDNPSLDRLFEMAEIILPVSSNAAVCHCNEILEKYPFHDGASRMIEELTHQKPPPM